MMKITENIHYIGADDLNLDLFESQYIVPEGMAYNSYVIEDEKIAIMDTIDSACGEVWKARLKEVLGDRTPDYLVVQHMEPDHSALIAWALEEYPSLTIVATAKAIAMMGQFFDGVDFTSRSQAVKEGDSLSLGKATLKFIMAPMVHWPEVMLSFEQSSGTLFAADAFGKFGALSKCGYFSDEEQDWECEARRYYFNIVGKYGGPVQSLLKKAKTLDIKIIAPLHGPILRHNLAHYVGLYDIWSSYAVETQGVFIAYASIYGGTAAVAKKLAGLLEAKGIKVSTSDLCRDDMAEAIEDAFRYGTLVVAASSYDGGVFTPAHDFISRLQEKNWQKRRVGLIENGSWAPSAGRAMKELFSKMNGVELVEPLVTIRSRMKASDEPALEALADALAEGV